MLNAILIVHKYSTLVATQASCPHREVPRRAHVQLCLQLFLLEEDLSVHSVRAGGSGVRAGEGGGLRPRSDQLQLCIRQAVVVRYSRLEEGGKERGQRHFRKMCT